MRLPVDGPRRTRFPLVRHTNPVTRRCGNDRIRCQLLPGGRSSGQIRHRVLRRDPAAHRIGRGAGIHPGADGRALFHAVRRLQPRPGDAAHRGGGPDQPDPHRHRRRRPRLHPPGEAGRQAGDARPPLPRAAGRRLRPGLPAHRVRRVRHPDGREPGPVRGGRRSRPAAVDYGRAGLGRPLPPLRPGDAAAPPLPAAASAPLHRFRDERGVLRGHAAPRATTSRWCPR